MIAPPPAAAHASAHVRARVDWGRVRDNAGAIAAAVGVPVLAVVKADAYGLGAVAVAEAVAEWVEGFCVFSLEEALAADLKGRIGKPVLAIGPPTADAGAYLAAGVRPAVSTPEQAAALRRARPAACVDVGMQRFACPPEGLAAVLAAGGCEEAFAHAIDLRQVGRLAGAVRDAAGGRAVRLHAAGSSLLAEPAARLGAVRPGLALYRGAVRVSARLVEARDTRGPAGYTGFVAPRHGVILAGHSHGLRPGPCLVNGVPRRLPEVGMQSAYVELGPHDRAGDEVVLLGDEGGATVSEQQVAAAWRCTPHEALLRLARAGVRGDKN